MQIAPLLIAAYLIGSIPFGVIVGRARGVDIRKYGSGNIGASNVLRLLGPGPAAVVFAGDVVKGLAPVLIARHLLGHLVGQGLAPDSWLLAVGLATILGHSFSVFLRFTGGRGVATTLGALLGMSWHAGLVGLGIWLAVVALTRYISVASICASSAVPIYLALAGATPAWALFWTGIAALIIARHIPNIGRLLEGTESKIGQRVDVAADEPATRPAGKRGETPIR